MRSLHKPAQHADDCLSYKKLTSSSEITKGCQCCTATCATIEGCSFQVTIGDADTNLYYKHLYVPQHKWQFHLIAGRAC